MDNVVKLSPEIEIDALASRLNSLKQSKSAIDKDIKNTEEALIALVGSKPEGSFSVSTESFKVTTTGKVYRKVDETKLTALRKLISKSIFNKVFRTKHDVNLKELRHYQNNEPDVYTDLAEVITTTPGKTAIKVEALN